MSYHFKLSQRVARIRARAVLVGAAVLFAACDTSDLSSLHSSARPSFATSTGAPAQVTDLAAAAVTDTSAILTFSEVDDGTGAPASYDVRSVPGGSISWGSSAPSVTQGTCATPVAGTAIGAQRRCTVLGLAPATTYSFQLVSYRGTLRLNAVFGPLSNTTGGTTSAGQAVASGVPGAVTDLAIAGKTDTSLTLSFTDVTDGSGHPANYDVRDVAGSTLTWGSSAPSVKRGTCATPVVGTSIGAKRTCTVLGLAASTTYSFELVAYRGTLNVNAVFGNLSNLATGTTVAPAPAPVVLVKVTPATGSLAVGSTLQLTATPQDSAGRALSGRAVTWTSSSGSIAGVSGAGLVTGVGAGSATITATSGGKSGTAAITVTAAPPPPPPPPPSGSCGGSACHYVDGTAGNDANPGTSSAPWRTIQHAADVMNPGDTVVVNDGVYTGGANVVTVSRSGTASEWLVLRAAHRWGAVIDGQGNSSYVGIEINGKYIRVEGFEVRNTSRYGIDAYNGHDIAVVGDDIHDVGHVCTDDVGGRVGVDAYARNLTIERNLIHDVGRLGPGEQGCSPSTTAWQNHDHGIYQGSEYAGQSDNLVIRNNVFYHFTHGWAVQRYEGSGTIVNGLSILNNTFVGANPWRDGQIIIATGVNNLVIENNIFYQPTTAGVWFDTGGLSNVTLSDNLSFGAAVSEGLSGMTSSGNLGNVDPRFVNPSGLDFHVQSGSPAIGAGMTLSNVPNDFDGVVRSGAYTIGAYQFH